MSGRVRTKLADGRWVRGFRKTLRRHYARAPQEMPDWRVTLLLPDALSLVAPGHQGVAGITIEPDPFSGPLAVATGKGLEWCCRQLGRFLLAISPGIERIMTAIATREGESHTQSVALMPGSVEFPRFGAATWRVER